MFTRTTGFFILPLWLAAMGWLFAHDVWPAWTAHEPPRLRPTRWLAGQGKRAQHIISDELGPMGTLWTTYLVDDMSVQRQDLIWIERLPANLAPLRVQIDSTFTTDGLLDELTVRFENQDGKMELHGERFHSGFSFMLQAGATEHLFKVPLTDGSIISGAFNPFEQLTDLEVGQTWRMQVFNPVAALTGIGDQFIPMLVEVTGRGTIATADGEHDCLVVQSLSAKAWVDARGVVIAQEVTLPVVGRIRITRQSDFDENAYTAVARKTLDHHTESRP